MMARAILYGVVIYLLFRLFRRLFQRPRPTAPKLIDDVLETDPVNGIRVPRKEALMEVVEGKTYYFSTDDTRREFLGRHSGR